jgi:hypothetical protein
MLPLGDKEHVLILQDETIFHTNEYRRRSWLAGDQQPLRKKGGGRAIHVSEFICETIGRLKLSDEQISDQMKCPPELRLDAFEARKITYPGKGFDPWWDLRQLVEQIKHAIAIFDHTHPDCVGVFVFDRSSAHEGFAEDALNVNTMNVHPARSQRPMCDTIIPLNNPDPAPGEEDTCGQIQQMCFPEDHEDLALRGKPKGMRAVLQERKSVWDKFSAINKARGTNLIGRCASCKKSGMRKDAERRLAIAEAIGKEEDVTENDIATVETEAPPVEEEAWCCMYRVLSLQEDFRTEKPLIQMMIEKAGHVCLFLPWFHCELNPIEMLWGYAKYRACYGFLIPPNVLICTFQDIAMPLMGGFQQRGSSSHSVLMSAILSRFIDSFKRPGDIWTLTGMCNNAVPRICDRLDNAITRLGLNARQAAFANKKYKLHRRVGLPSDIIAALAPQDS